MPGHLVASRCRALKDLPNSRTGSPAGQNNGTSNHPLDQVLLKGFHTFSTAIPISLFRKDYISDPHDLGSSIRKVRMDKGLQIKELAQMLEVTEDTVINWEKRGVKPVQKSLSKVMAFLDGTFG